MKTRFNKKKVSFLPGFQLIKYFFLLILLLVIIFIIYNDLKKDKKFYFLIQKISEKYDYQFTNIEINTLKRVDKKDILKILKEYDQISIFLISLKKISNSLNDLTWVKNANLSTNFKNVIKVEILEYQPIGLYFYNNELFYFNDEGKIIDKKKQNLSEEFIIFSGKGVLKKAINLIKILENINDNNLLNVHEAIFVNERRWNIKLKNNIVIYLSEKNIEESINNYLKLIRNINNLELNMLKKIDLRNNQKAIISFKE